MGFLDNVQKALSKVHISPTMNSLNDKWLEVFEVHGAIRRAWQVAANGTFEEKLANFVVGLFVSVVVWAIAAVVDLNTTYTTINGSLMSNIGLVPAIMRDYIWIVALVGVFMPLSVELLGAHLAQHNVAKIRPVLYAVIAFDALTDIGLAMTSAAYALQMACGNNVALSEWTCYRLALSPYFLVGIYIFATALLLLVYSFYLEAVGLVILAFTVASGINMARQYPEWIAGRKQRATGQSRQPRSPYTP